MVLGSDVFGKDSTLHASVFCAGRVSRYYNSSRTNPSEQIWNFCAAPVPGFQLGGLVHWRNLRAGIQYSQNYYRRWEHFNYANLGTGTPPMFDSLYGQLWLHLIELIGGFDYKINSKIEIMALGRIGPRAINGKSFTVGRYHKDSIVYGSVIIQPTYTFGLEFRLMYNIAHKTSISLGLYYDRINRDKMQKDNSYKDPTLANKPQEYRYFPSGRYYGANFGLVYNLR